VPSLVTVVEATKVVKLQRHRSTVNSPELDHKENSTRVIFLIVIGYCTFTTRKDTACLMLVPCPNSSTFPICTKQ
jgi:hypothetical protein